MLSFPLLTIKASWYQDPVRHIGFFSGCGEVVSNGDLVRFSPLPTTPPQPLFRFQLIEVQFSHNSFAGMIQRWKKAHRVLLSEIRLLMSLQTVPWFLRDHEGGRELFFFPSFPLFFPSFFPLFTLPFFTLSPQPSHNFSYSSGFPCKHEAAWPPQRDLHRELENKGPGFCDEPFFERKPQSLQKFRDRLPWRREFLTCGKTTLGEALSLPWGSPFGEVPTPEQTRIHHQPWHCQGSRSSQIGAMSPWERSRQASPGRAAQRSTGLWDGWPAAVPAPALRPLGSRGSLGTFPQSYPQSRQRRSCSGFCLGSGTPHGNDGRFQGGPSQRKPQDQSRVPIGDRLTCLSEDRKDRKEKGGKVLGKRGREERRGSGGVKGGGGGVVKGGGWEDESVKGSAWRSSVGS